MDKVKHEITAALTWLEEGNVERAKLHLFFALAHLGDEAVEQPFAPDGATSPSQVWNITPAEASGAQTSSSLPPRR